MTIPFLDPSQTYLEIREELDEAYRRVMLSGSYILGETLSCFENNFARYCDAAHCIGVSNGLDALTLILRGFNIGKGDEVIVPAHTFIATWLAVSNVGATPVPVEIDEHTYNLNADLIKTSINHRTRAIIAVHLYGQPADMSAIMEVAKKNDLLVIEDAAQAHGASYKGQRVGSFGDAAAWSFYPGKNLGAFGDGGAITTNNDNLAQNLLMLRNYGAREKYQHEVLGYNNRLDPLQAAFLDVKLRHLDRWNSHRAALAKRYIEGLGKTPLILPFTPEWANSVWHLFVVRYPQRDLLQAHLDSLGINTLIHYPTPPHKQLPYVHTIRPGNSLSRTEELSEQILSLPIGPHLTFEQCDRVVSVIAKFIT
ncbi:DegT/DnrJ/EryC1/StrS family aminotransferase [Thalassospira sp. MA62]|nr:DegT/DnrJ/EryC1/StrS family aminotransferase [Thalassospira sp. MA62]